VNDEYENVDELAADDALLDHLAAGGAPTAGDDPATAFLSRLVARVEAVPVPTATVRAANPRVPAARATTVYACSVRPAPVGAAVISRAASRRHRLFVPIAAAAAVAVVGTAAAAATAGSDRGSVLHPLNTWIFGEDAPRTHAPHPGGSTSPRPGHGGSPSSIPGVATGGDAPTPGVSGPSQGVEGAPGLPVSDSPSGPGVTEVVPAAGTSPTPGASSQPPSVAAGSVPTPSGAAEPSHTPPAMGPPVTPPAGWGSPPPGPATGPPGRPTTTPGNRPTTKPAPVNARDPSERAAVRQTQLAGRSRTG
jgi:hypothetical protein